MKGILTLVGVRAVRLSEWRKDREWTQGELADALGCSQSFISLIERRIDPQIPGRDWLLAIYKLTRGAVSPNDFYDLPPIGQMSLPLHDQDTDAPLLEAVA